MDGSVGQFKNQIKKWLTVQGDSNKQGDKLEELCIHIARFYPWDSVVQSVLRWKDFLVSKSIQLTRKDRGTDLVATVLKQQHNNTTTQQHNNTTTQQHNNTTTSNI